MKVEYRFIKESKDEASKDKHWYTWGNPMSDMAPGPLGKMLQSVFCTEFTKSTLGRLATDKVDGIVVTFSDGSSAEFRRVE